MLEKFVSIKNIGRFRDCNPRGDVSFRKLTLLFAENGQGKTTLCAILRSLQSGRYEFISERKTLGAGDPCSAQIRLDGNTISFSNDSWSATYPNIAIFDSVFVHDNVYAGDYVEHDHKKNLYRVIIGAQGVQLAQKVDALDGQIRDANKEIGTKEDAASTYLPHGITLGAYLTWQPVDDIEDKIKLKSAQIANRQRALDKADEIQTKGLLTKIQLPYFHPTLPPYLQSNWQTSLLMPKPESSNKLLNIKWAIKVNPGFLKGWDTSRMNDVLFADKISGRTTLSQFTAHTSTPRISPLSRRWLS